MYYTLFHKTTDVIEELQEIQRETEVLFVLQALEPKAVASAGGESGGLLFTVQKRL